MSSKSEITRILEEMRAGDAHAAEILLPLIYSELRELARVQMKKERRGHTLQPTALVHEVYLRLVGDAATHYQNRAHFFGAAATAMRRILVEYARPHQALKRGGERRRIALEDTAAPVDGREEDFLAVDDALTRLSEIDPRKGRVVELLFFGGLTAEEAASVLDISIRTIHRDWSYAKAWLYREIM